MSSSEDPQNHEIRPDPAVSTANSSRSKNVSDIDYEPHPEQQKIKLEPERQHIVDSITRLYSGSASEQDCQVYDEKAIYDDPWSYCDTRYKIAGQWYGIPKIFNPSQTLKTEVVESEPDRIIFKLQQEYSPKGLSWSKTANSLVTLTLDSNGKVKYHKDMWNEKDYSHEGLGKIMKTLNGDQLTKITRPPKTL
ncbi:hypothetical protein K461DRAFT_290618 [Myriangium duriaei CBS 260.36]|uniref:Uncharacterized protein n=1 Tax=Myriangium duriaei CBS 260.36 TaxID=1168546 RepID=A0A9P4J6I0_9PEZI|nr:hypothetical protein K461DRAFT_290618 [Myriangium duriaei CBS 260.36]